MKKYYFFVTGCQHWFDIARDLHEKGIATPSLWLGDDRHYGQAKAFFGHDVVLRMLNFVHRPWKLNNIEYNGEYSDFFYSENYLRAKDRCIKMMDRLDLYGLFTRLDREVYFNKLAIWYLSNLEGSFPDALIMVDSPHSHAQYLLYEICQYAGVPTAKFNSWAMLAPTLILEDMANDRLIENSVENSTRIVDKIDRQVTEYVSTMVEKAKSGVYELSYIKKQRQQHMWLAKMYSVLTSGATMQYRETKSQIGMLIRGEYNPINPHNVGTFGRLRNEYNRRRNLRVFCKKHQDKLALDKKFVYFALHYEPERTTNPDGGKFHDQVLAVIALRNFVPDDIEIVVKEHPTQFYERHRGPRGRSPLIYNLLKNIKGVRLLSPFENSIELQKKCVFVATITGSIAVEAAILGKKTLTFGKTWFSSCPNIIAWDDCTTYEEFLDTPVGESNEILDFILGQRQRHCVVGFQNISIEKRYADYSDEEFKRHQHIGVFGLMQSYFASLPEAS